MDYKHLEKIIRQIADGTDPTTGEIIPDEAYTDPGIYKAVKALEYRARLAYKGKRLSRNLLNRPTDQIFEDLKAWRLSVARKTGMPAYIVFSDADIRAIAEGDVIEKEDLLKIKGFGAKKMAQYGDEVYDILLPYIHASDYSTNPYEDLVPQKGHTEIKRKSSAGLGEKQIKVGCFVRILDLNYDEELTFLIVNQTTKTHYLGYAFIHGQRIPLTEDVLETGGDGIKCITPQSVIGKNLMNKHIGDRISYKNENGDVETFEVLDIILPEQN